MSFLKWVQDSNYFEEFKSIKLVKGIFTLNFLIVALLVLLCEPKNMIKNLLQYKEMKKYFNRWTLWVSNWLSVISRPREALQRVLFCLTVKVKN